MLYKIKINKGCIKVAVFFAVLILSLSSCNNGDDYEGAKKESTFFPELKLSFVIPSVNVSTRADDGYEAGITYENEINLSAFDYSIYFFTYESGDESGGTLIAEFYPTSVTSSFQGDETIYTVTGSVPDDLLEKTDFRAVVLANWDNSYPSVTVGETTISQLTSSTNSTFLAQDKFELSASHLIPFYGVQEYSDITFYEGETTPLPEDVYLLRALAKVEVVLKDEDDLSFSKVILHNYNAEGYSAPKDIYLSSQYNHGDWDEDYVQTLHLVGDANDVNATDNTISFVKTQDREVNEATGEVIKYETWDLYIPEYDNTTDEDNAAYIEVWFDYQMEDDEPYQIYFKNYETDGTLGENATTWDIYRNNLYRFNVSLGEYDLQVNVQDWGEVFDNKLTYGTMSEITPSGETISFENNTIMYEVISDNEDEGLTVKLTHVDNRDYYSIPSTIYYLGYTYTVVSIGSGCFQADNSVLFISIPKTVTDIESLAFYGDTSLKAIALHSETPPTCASDAFSGGDNVESITLYVPESSVDTYKGSDVWGDFENIVGIDYSQYE